MTPTAMIVLLFAVGGLVGGHAALPLLIDAVDPTLQAALAVAHGLAVVVFVWAHGRASLSGQIAYWATLAALTALMWPLLRLLPENLLAASLVTILYAGLSVRPFLVGYLVALVVALVYAAAYAWQAFAILALVYTGTQPLGRLWQTRANRLVGVFYILGMALLATVLLPVVYFATQASSQTLFKTAAIPPVRAALWLSAWTATASVALVLAAGVPLAYVLTRLDFPGRRLLTALVDVPLLIPPPVAGVAMLALLGPTTPLGQQLETWTAIRFVSAVPGVIAVQVFVGAPFVIRAAMIAFAAVDPHYEQVARTLGASAVQAFARVALPLATPGILIGAVLMWFRAVGEFGATFLLVPSPETAPVLIWKFHQSRSPAESQAVAVLMLLACVALFAGFLFLGRALSGRFAAPQP